MRPCTDVEIAREGEEGSIFYPLDESSLPYFGLNNPEFYCVDNWQDLRISGNSQTSLMRRLIVEVKRCNEVNCTSPASEDEINDAIADTLLLVRSNSKSFNGEEYGQNTVKKHSNLFFSLLNTQQNLVNYFWVQQSELELQDKPFNFD